MTLNLEPRTQNWRAAMVALLSSTLAAHAQVQQAWVARYNNGVTNGQHQALKVALDRAGKICGCGFSRKTPKSSAAGCDCFAF